MLAASAMSGARRLFTNWQARRSIRVSNGATKLSLRKNLGHLQICSQSVVLATHEGFRTQSSRMFSSGGAEEEDSEVPQSVDVPQGAIRFKAVRSSGPGGQAVNKQSTCVEARVNLYEAYWLPNDARERLMENEKNRINKDGDLFVVVQQERTQEANKRIAQKRMQEILDASLIEPKERDMWTGLADVTKEKRKEGKRFRSKIKQARKVTKFDW